MLVLVLLELPVLGVATGAANIDAALNTQITKSRIALGMVQLPLGDVAAGTRLG